MIVILSWKYNDDDIVLDAIKANSRLENINELAVKLGVSIATLNRKLRILKKEGKLVSHRYKNNNLIWCIGGDVDYNAWEAYQIAKYRYYVDMGGDTEELDNATVEEQENMLIDIPVFDSEKEEAQTDAGYAYMQKFKKLMKNKNVKITQELKDYVDELWKKS